MKKTTGFLFLLLANFALLAHIVIPHHHHDEDGVTICYYISSENSVSHN
jgi:hypothetical protein